MSKYKKIQSLLPITPISNGCYIYVYKVTNVINSTYYIGQTEDIKRRLYRHYFCIKNTIKGVECKALPFHKSIANSIRNNNLILPNNIESLVIKSISFEILHMATSKLEANSFEYSVIDKASDSFCLNKRFN